MKKLSKKIASVFLMLALAASTAACGSADSGAAGTDANGTTDASDATGAPAEAAEGEKIINVGVTSSLGGINPFVIDQT